MSRMGISSGHPVAGRFNCQGKEEDGLVAHYTCHAGIKPKDDLEQFVTDEPD